VREKQGGRVDYVVLHYVREKQGGRVEITLDGLF
jgi:hypothetical protein